MTTIDAVRCFVVSRRCRMVGWSPASYITVYDPRPRIRMSYSIEGAEVSDICMTVLDEVVRSLARTLGALSHNTIVAIAFDRVVVGDYEQTL